MLSNNINVRLIKKLHQTSPFLLGVEIVFFKRKADLKNLLVKKEA
jgi:hypothetical protein